MKIIMGLALVFYLLGCKKEESSSSNGSSVDEVATLLEAGIAGANGVMDEQEDEDTQALVSAQSDKAACIGRAVNASCNSGVKTITYTDCTLGSVFTLDGTVTLTYSDAGCGMNSTNDNVTRTYDYDVTGPLGGTTTITSTNENDYRGNSIGGGAVLTTTASGWTIDILGKHRKFTFANGRSGFHVSLRSTSDFVITGGLARANRTIESGTLEVIHNKAEFISTLVYANVGFENGCCYPVSGSINVTLSGSKTGSGTVSFGSCGNATATIEGEDHSITFKTCE